MQQILITQISIVTYDRFALYSTTELTNTLITYHIYPQYHGAPLLLTDILSYMNLTFTLCFTVECILKLISYGPGVIFVLVIISLLLIFVSHNFNQYISTKYQTKLNRYNPECVYSACFVHPLLLVPLPPYVSHLDFSYISVIKRAAK